MGERQGCAEMRLTAQTATACFCSSRNHLSSLLLSSIFHSHPPKPSTCSRPPPSTAMSERQQPCFYNQGHTAEHNFPKASSKLRKPRSHLPSLPSPHAVVPHTRAKAPEQTSSGEVIQSQPVNNPPKPGPWRQGRGAAPCQRSQ